MTTGWLSDNLAFPKEIGEIVAEYEEGSFRLNNSSLSLLYQRESNEDEGEVDDVDNDSDEDEDDKLITNIIPLPAKSGIWFVRWAPPVYLKQASYRILLIYHQDAALEELSTDIKLPREKELDSVYEEESFLAEGNFTLCSNDRPLLDIKSWGPHHIRGSGNVIMNDYIFASSTVIAIPIRRYSDDETNVWYSIRSALTRIGTDLIALLPEKLRDTVNYNKVNTSSRGKGAIAIDIPARDFHHYFPNPQPIIHTSPYTSLYISYDGKTIEEESSSPGGPIIRRRIEDLAPRLRGLPKIAQLLGMLEKDWWSSPILRGTYIEIMRKKDMKAMNHEQETNRAISLLKAYEKF